MSLSLYKHYFEKHDGAYIKTKSARVLPPPPPPSQRDFQGWGIRHRFEIQRKRRKIMCAPTPPPPKKKMNRSHIPMALVASADRLSCVYVIYSVSFYSDAIWCKNTNLIQVIIRATRRVIKPVAVFFFFFFFTCSCIDILLTLRRNLLQESAWGKFTHTQNNIHRATFLAKSVRTLMNISSLRIRRQIFHQQLSKNTQQIAKSSYRLSSPPPSYSNA